MGGSIFCFMLVERNTMSCSPACLRACSAKGQVDEIWPLQPPGDREPLAGRGSCSQYAPESVKSRDRAKGYHNQTDPLPPLRPAARLHAGRVLYASCMINL